MNARMRMGLLGGLAAAVLVGGIGAAWAQASAENWVRYRSNIMRAQAAHLTAINQVIKGDVTLDPSHIAAHAQAIVDTATLIPAAFPEGTGPESGAETDARPEIWTDRAGFEADAQALHDAALTLQTAAAAGDMAAVQAAFGTVGQACGACHTDYRAD